MISDVEYINLDCNSIAGLMSVEFIKEVLGAG